MAQATVGQRGGEYLVSVRSGSVVNPQARVLSVLDTLKAMPDVEVLHTIKPSGFNLLSTDGSGGVDIHVIRTTTERAAALQASAASTPDVLIEPNHRLQHLGQLFPRPPCDPDGFFGHFWLPSRRSRSSSPTSRATPFRARPSTFGGPGSRCRARPTTRAP